MLIKLIQPDPEPSEMSVGQARAVLENTRALSSEIDAAQRVVDEFQACAAEE